MTRHTNTGAVHAVPTPGSRFTPCCGIPPTELPRNHRVTPDLQKLTCPGRPERPLHELVGIVLTTTQRPRVTRVGRLFLPHGDDDGHVWDVRCALCVGDISLLAATLTEALSVSFPDADVINLQSRRPRRRTISPLALQCSPLRNLLAVVLATTTRPGAIFDGTLHPHGQSDGHTYDRRCALCVGDTATLADAIEAALRRALPSLVPMPRTPTKQIPAKPIPTRP